MLTIGQLASYTGVTVRTVHFYHHKGLLPEPERDRAGYRRYGAEAVVELIRIRTLAEAGVPLSRVHELLVADHKEFTTAVENIDRRLKMEIGEKREQRRRIARLAAGDSLALPPEAVAYLDHLRQLGFPDRLVDLERNAWILVAAQLPEQMPMLMSLKRAQLDDPAVIGLYRDLMSTLDWKPNDPRLPALADQLASLIDAATADEQDYDGEFELDDDTVDLLDSVFLDSVPIGRRLLELLEERGWTGWTRLERVDASSQTLTKTTILDARADHPELESDDASRPHRARAPQGSAIARPERPVTTPHGDSGDRGAHIPTRDRYEIASANPSAAGTPTVRLP